MALNSNAHDEPIKIHYNDKTVNLSPNKLLGIKRIDRHDACMPGTSALDHPKKFKQNYSDLPKPIFLKCNNASSNSAKACRMPPSYIKYTVNEEEGESSRNDVEYDLDREDIAWLKLINTQRLKKGYSLIEESNLEKAIDLLEKESQFQFSQFQQNNLLPLVDNDAPCCICNDGEDSNANQIIFCDMCNIAVHQDCYGVPYIPEGQWLCRRCQFSPSVAVNCVLCPFTTGAFKQTADGRWVHVICALWLSEVHFANPILLEPVEGVDRTLMRRQKLKCIICTNKMGACMQCSNRACSRSFHTTCAFYANLKMEINEVQSKKSQDSIINRFAYCHEHSQIRPKDDISKAAWKREVKERFSRVRNKLNTDKKETNNTVPTPMIAEEKVDLIANNLQIEQFSDILNYWSLKRKSRYGVPLIRRLQVYLEKQKPILVRHSIDDAVPAIDVPSTSSLASQVSLQSQQLHPQRRLRRNFERIRLLCELVKKREKLKLNALLAIEEIMQKFKPLNSILHETLQKLIDKDYYKVFTQPVDEVEVPGYYSIINDPMDFQEMQRRLDAGNYKRISDLRTDFLLMMKNCDTFNKDNQYFYKYGKRIRNIGLNVIKSAEVESVKVSQLLPMMGQVADQLNLLDKDSLNRFQKELDWHQQQQLSNSPQIDEQSNKRNSTEEKLQPARKRSTGGKKSVSNKNLSPVISSDIPLTHDISPVENNTTIMESTRKDSARRKQLRKTQTPAINNEKQTERISSQTESSQKKCPDLQNLKESANSKKHQKKSIETSKKQQHEIIKDTEEVNAAPTGNIQCSNGNEDTNQIELTTTVQNGDDNHVISTRTKRSLKKRSVAELNNQQNNQERDEGNMSNKRIKIERQPQNPFKCTNGRGVAKQSYANTYLTEASSAADEGDSEIDALFLSINGDKDELPSIDINTMSRKRNKARIRRPQKQKFMESPPSIALHNEFRHNDIVWAKLDNDISMPARVIDILMRYDIDNGDGFGSDFIEKAMQKRPKDHSEYTLVVLFDKQDTCDWMSNDRLRICHEIGSIDSSNATVDVVSGAHSPVVLEALDKARQFFKNVIEV